MAGFARVTVIDTKTRSPNLVGEGAADVGEGVFGRVVRIIASDGDLDSRDSIRNLVWVSRQITILSPEPMFDLTVSIITI